MKKITMLFAALMLLAALQPAAANTMYDNDDKSIAFSELPAAAQHFIKKHFATEEVSLVLLDSGVISNEYEVMLASGTKVEFDGSGEWKEIKCRQGEVPADLVPAKIANYVGKHYSGTKIVELKRDYREWEVKLGNGLELTFDTDFKLREIDD